MIGHRAVEKARAQRQRPASVLFELLDGPYEKHGWWDDPEESLKSWNQVEAVIRVEPSEDISALDLRFVVGLPVRIEGEWCGRMERFCEAVIAHRCESMVAAGWNTGNFRIDVLRKDGVRESQNG